MVGTGCDLPSKSHDFTDFNITGIFVAKHVGRLDLNEIVVVDKYVANRNDRVSIFVVCV